MTEQNVIERVLAAALDEAAAGVAVQFAGQLSSYLGRAATLSLRDAIDQLVADLRPMFDEVAAGVAEAARRFRPWDSAEVVLMTGDDAAVDAWRALPGHVAALDAVRSVFRSLRPRAGQDVQDYIAPVPDAVRLEHGRELWQRTGLGAPWLHLAADGYRLHLNSTAEGDAVADRAQERTAQAEHETGRQRARADERRRHPLVDAL